MRKLCYAVAVGLVMLIVARAAFGVPGQFTPIGAISIGYSDEPPRDLSRWRKPATETVHRGRWNQPGDR